MESEPGRGHGHEPRSMRSALTITVVPPIICFDVSNHLPKTARLRLTLAAAAGVPVPTRSGHLWGHEASEETQTAHGQEGLAE